MGIAKNAYVRGRSGWFSDRSAHYLASGRPVLAQATGFERHLPTGRGLLAFADLEEAAAAGERIGRDCPGRCPPARAVAAELLDCRQVLRTLLSGCLSWVGVRLGVVVEDSPVGPGGLRDLLVSVLGGSGAPCRMLGRERLAANVDRLRFDAGGRARSLVVKSSAPQAAR